MSEVIHWQTLTPEQRDVLVHEKVMGVTELNCTGKMVYDGEDADESPFFICKECGVRLLLPNYYNRGTPKSHVVNIPDYTKSLDAAWLVVQKMSKVQPEDVSFPSIDDWFRALLVQVKIWSMPLQEAADLICRGALELQGWKDGYKVVD